MKNNSHLSRAERITRIGELLAKGVGLMLLREAEDKQNAAASVDIRANGQAGDPPGGPHPADVDDLEKEILDYLKRVRCASPRDIQLALSTCKATVFRKLTRFVKDGIVVRTGRTTSVRYRLSSTLLASPNPARPAVLPSDNKPADRGA